MSLDAVIKKIDRHLKKDFVQPLIVDVQNSDDFQAIWQHYNVGSYVFLKAQDYCGKDSIPQFDKLYSDLAQNEGIVFVTGISIFLKLQGEQFLKESLRTLLSLSTKGHIVVITYQCRKYLTFSDPRLQNRIFIVEAKEAHQPSLIFASDNFKTKTSNTVVNGLDSLSVVENTDVEQISVYTKKTRTSFPLSLIYITDLNKAYDVLCSIDKTTAQLTDTLGTDAQWAYALELFENKSSWGELIESLFGNRNALQHIIQNFMSYSDNQKWLYFVALKLYGCPENWCLDTASKTATGSTDIVRHIYRGILSVEPKSKDFSKIYNQRKQLLNQLGNPLDEVVDFCKVVISKGENAIYYLTDNTQKEKDLIFAMLDKYGLSYEKRTLIDILGMVYPDLASYLAPFNFRNELLNQYFEQYKYQKVINRVLPEFEAIVTEQAIEREYNLILQPRSSLVEGIDKTGAQLYFMDAMGVEYLSFILAKCKELNLMLKITVCRSELPSITSQNKEFLEYFQGSEFPVVSIKDIDEIKHHGKYNYDYQQTKLPIHLSKELDVISEVLDKIKEKLASGTISKAIMIADHGASRLAVIHETETVWEMPEKGEHSGRCCLKSEIDETPAYATDAGDFWALANYDRFKGSRKANVEVHGGATLEEITVPIIEITYNPGKVEVHILPVAETYVDFNATPEIEVSFRKKAAVRIYISATVSDVNLRIDGKIYEAQSTEPNYFYVEMPDIKRPKTYYADVFAGDNPLAENLPIKIKSEGMGSNKKSIL